MEVAKVSVAPEYKSTKKGATVGAVAGAATTAFAYGAASCNYLGMKGASIAAKKERISALKSILSSRGIDMAKTTVSKVVKAGRKAIASPVGILSTVVAGVAIGAGLGFVMDTIKNRNTKKA